MKEIVRELAVEVVKLVLVLAIIFFSLPCSPFSGCGDSKDSSNLHICEGG